MGECAGCYKSDEELAIERVAERLLKSMKIAGPSTDCIDRAMKDEARRIAEDEFIMIHGRKPKGIFD